MSSIPNIVVMDAEELVACRICLVGEGNLYDIHEWGLAEAFIKIMGIPVKGRVPQYLCTWCRTLLTKAWSLREKCHRADSLLKEMCQKEYVSNASIRSVDRSANQLTHTLTQTLLTDAQYYYTHVESNTEKQFTAIKPKPRPTQAKDQPRLKSDDSDKHFDSVEPCIVIDGESNEPRITIEAKTKKPLKSPPRKASPIYRKNNESIVIDGESNEPGITIEAKDKKSLKSPPRTRSIYRNKNKSFVIDGESNEPPITIEAKGKKSLKLPPRNPSSNYRKNDKSIVIDGESNEPRITIEAKTKKPLKSPPRNPSSIYRNNNTSIVIDGESNEPRITIEAKTKKPLKSPPRKPSSIYRNNNKSIVIDGESNEPPITIEAKDKKPSTSPPRKPSSIYHKNNKSIVIDGESNEPPITIEAKDKKPSTSPPRKPSSIYRNNNTSIVIDGETNEPRITIEAKDKKSLKLPPRTSSIYRKSNKIARITIGGDSDEQLKTDKPLIIIDGTSKKRRSKYNPITTEDKNAKKLKSEKPIKVGDDDDNIHDSDQPCNTAGDESERNKNMTNKPTYNLIEGDNIETADKINASELTADDANENDSDDDEVNEMMTPVTQMNENETDSEVKLPSAVVKNNDINIRGKKIPTIDECEELAKKYNFKVQYLTDKEMVEEMELRRTSERFKKRKYKCDMCHRGFMTPATYETHMNKYHNPLKKDNECELCKMTFSSDCQLQRHMKTSHEMRYTCVKCGHIVWNINECVSHEKKHGMRQCKFCAQSFIHGSAFAWHMRVAHPAENAASGSCEVCGEIFAGEKGLRAHKLLQHNKIPTAPGLQCKRCRVVFDSEEACRVHSEETSGKCDFSMSACTTCGLDCADTDFLLRHMRDEHQLPVHTCDQCDKLFLAESSLSIHMDRVHRGVKLRHPYKCQYQQKRGRLPVKRTRMCELCGKVFHCIAKLKYHQMSHTGERPFKCSICPRAFIMAKDLEEHEGIHAGLKKYKCPECPKEFYRQVSIYKHRLVHRTNMSVECQFCDKTFSHPGSLSAHVKYVHLKRRAPSQRSKRERTEA